MGDAMTPQQNDTPERNSPRGKQQNRESTVFIFHHPVVGVSAAPGPVETP